MPGIFDRIFNRGEKPVTSHDLKVALRGVTRDRKKKQMEMRRLSAKSDDIIGRMKDARKSNNKEEVDYLYEELQQLKLDQALSKREARVLNLEAIGLKRYSRAMERLEKAQSKTRIQDLIEKALGLSTGLSDELRAVVMNIDDPLRLVYVLATLLDMKPSDKQALLEATELTPKLEAIEEDDEASLSDGSEPLEDDVLEPEEWSEDDFDVERGVR